MNDRCDFKITLLGTGVPIPSPRRFGPSTLVEAGDQKLLIDAGRGATIRLYQLKIPIGRLDGAALRDQLLARTERFKVPAVFHFRDAPPSGSTGKADRGAIARLAATSTGGEAT